MLPLNQDMGLATEVADKQASPLPLGKAAREIYERAIQGKGDLGKKDFSSVYLHLRDSNL